MYLDLLSQSNYLSYNIPLARLFGLQMSVYISELISIQEKATRKNSLIDGYVFLDRDYISSRTTISSEDQLDLDSRLESLGILEKRSINEINLNLKQLSYIITQEDEPIKEEVISVMKKSKKLSKKVKDEYILDTLKRSINTSCDELRHAYYDWIDAVYVKDGYMTKRAVTYGQELIDKFSNRDLDVALSVLNIAAVNGYRDMSWAINYYSDNKKTYNNNFSNYQSAKNLSVGQIIK